jgi:hypothetical protein
VGSGAVVWESLDWGECTRYFWQHGLLIHLIQVQKNLMTDGRGTRGVERRGAAVKFALNAMDGQGHGSGFSSNADCKTCDGGSGI